MTALIVGTGTGALVARMKEPRRRGATSLPDHLGIRRYAWIIAKPLAATLAYGDKADRYLVERGVPLVIDVWLFDNSRINPNIGLSDAKLHQIAL